MALPVAQDVYDELVDFGITSTNISSSRVDEYLFQAVDYVEKLLARELDKETTVIGYYSGDSTNTLLLNHKKINEIVNINYYTGVDYQYGRVGAYELTDIGEIVLTPGFIFRKGTNNIKVEYKIGGAITDKEKKAVVLVATELVLNEIANRTGGGSISVQGWSKNYGVRAKYSSYKEDLMRRVNVLLCDQVVNTGGQV